MANKKTSKKVTKKVTAKKTTKKADKKVKKTKKADKKVAKKKTSKKTVTSSKSTGKTKLNPKAKISVTAKENPFREGSGRYDRFKAIKNGMTVEKALTKMGTDNLKMMVDKKLIKIKG